MRRLNQFFPLPPSDFRLILRAWPKNRSTAIDYLANPAKIPGRNRSARSSATRRSCGGRRFCVCGRPCLAGRTRDFSLTAFEGRDTLFRDVHEVLSTVAMFGGGKSAGGGRRRRRVRHPLSAAIGRLRRRSRAATGVLVLDLDSLPSNTRLYKSIAASGLLIDCRLAGAGG